MYERNNVLHNSLMIAALMKSDTNLLASDEDIYIFLGQDFSINLIDFIPDELKSEFIAFVENCTYAPSAITTKLRRFDGVYVDISAVIRKICLKESEYIDVRLFDIDQMTHHYFENASDNYIHSVFDRLIGGINFIYCTETKNIRINKSGKEIYSGPIVEWRDNAIANGYIEKDCIEVFYQICNAVADANGSGFFVTETSFFSDDITKHEVTSFNFSVVSYDQRPAYTVGIISNTEFPDRSFLDPLTCLYNKREIRKITDSVLDKSLKCGTKTAIAIIDLDHFKEMNDTYGHLSGDKALMNTARIIKDIIGSRGYVGRIGGDEFFAVLPDLSDLDELRRLLRCIRAQIRWHFLHCDEDVNVTCSIGAAVFPDNADNYNDIFKLTDHCLYLAKTKGRNRFIVYTPDKHGSVEEILKNDSVVQKEHTFSEDDKRDHILSVINRSNMTDNIKDSDFVHNILTEIHDNYKINGVQYCSLDKSRYFDVCDYPVKDKFTFIDIFDTFKDRLNSRGYLSLGNYMNAKSFLPELAEYMSENELRSVFIVPDTPDKDETRGIFIMTTQNQRSWSEYDINSLMILCGILGRFI